MGTLTGSARPGQTDLGYFYADNTILLWNRAVSAMAAQHVQSLGDAARLFALVYLAEADAGITAWDSKKFYNFWRPITAIREGDNDTNSWTIGDPDWKPLINTPNYPDYTSGANNVAGSVTKMLSLFFKGDKMTFTVTSNYPLVVQKVRTYTHFSTLPKMSSMPASTRVSISVSPTRLPAARASRSQNGRTSTSSDRSTATTTIRMMRMIADVRQQFRAEPAVA